MVNGEDVIADVKEAYPNQDTYAPLGYFLTYPYQVTITATAEMLFEAEHETPQKINDLNLELFPWIPLSENERTLVVLSNVATIYNPHPEVVGKWKKLVETTNGTIEDCDSEGSHTPDGRSD
jgi:hypothetical protein